MATVIKTRSEQRLAELEALKRPLTEEECAEVRKCLHAIYMQRWRAEAVEREMNAAALREHGICHESMAKSEIEGIATRMEEARCESWPLPKAADWQDHAREASGQLRDAIFRVHGKMERVAA